jgi:sugar phosphate isomerase/epimerase
MTERLISLAHLTLIDLAPPDLVTVAAAAGFGGVGVRLTPVRNGPEYPIHPGSPMLRETVRRLADSGVQVLDVEVIRLRPDTDVNAFEPFLEMARELGARHAIVTVEDRDLGRAASTFAALCERAARYSIVCVLEFMVFSQVATLPEAVQLVSSAQRPNAAVLIDALHLARSGGTASDVASTPVQLLPYVQLCDAATLAPAPDAASARDEARLSRLLTGSGVLPLAELIQALPPDTAVSLEIPDGWENPDPVGRARSVLEAAYPLLAGAGLQQPY